MPPSVTFYLSEYGAGYFGTSAKENWQIAELARAIRAAIDWKALPKVVSTELFQQIKAFLGAEKQAARLLRTEDELYYAFLPSQGASRESAELRAQFETCLKHVESSGLIRRFGFGHLVLLQPELLDSYASALLITVKNEAQGLGSISEERVRKGLFYIPREERLNKAEDEKLLLIAMVEEMLRHELALREHGELIFPSQFSLESVNLTDPKGRAVSMVFEGSVLNIYTTLVVRLSNSKIFKRQELWKNAVTYTTAAGGTYGMFLQHNMGERAELILFFDQAASRDMRFHFEEFVYEHLQQHALPQSVHRTRLFVCPACGVSFTDEQVSTRRSRGFTWLPCLVCETKVSLLERDEQLIPAPVSRIEEMRDAADNERDREAARMLLEGKMATGDFDVFLSYNHHDATEVKKIGEQLKVQGIYPWLDEWELQPGRRWQRELQKHIGQIPSAAVFVGKDGIGPWEDLEQEAFLQEFVKRNCPVIPVILENAPHEPQLPPFLRVLIWVDFRKHDPDPLERLLWGISGKRIPVISSS